jgi:dipeptidyl aminopeptidase/acylaminoacyl peptidase
MKKQNIIMVIALLLLFVISVNLQSQQLITPEKLMSLKRISGVKLSPDGKNILLTVSTPSIQENSSVSDIYLLPSAGGEMKRLTYSGKRNYNGFWSPDSKKFCFISDRNTNSQGFIMDLDGGDAKQVTEMEDGIEFISWSPNGKYLAFVSDVKMERTINEIHSDMPKANVRVYTDLPVRHWDEWTDEKFRHLFTLPLDGSKPIDLMKEDKFDTPLKPFGGESQIAWSSDGNEIAYTCKKVADFESSTNSSIFTAPAKGGKSINITMGEPGFKFEGFEMDPLYSPNGVFIAFKSQKRAGFESDKITLMTYSLKTGRYNDLTAKFDNWVENICWSGDSRYIYFTADKEGKSQIFRVSATGGEIETILSGPCNYGDRFLAVSPDDKTIYFSKRDFNGPEEIYSMPLLGKEKTIKQLTFVNTDAMKDIKKTTFEEKWITTRDGKKLHSWVVYPPDFDKNKKYPMITYCQGGPQQAVTPHWSYGWNFLLMASKGYIVLAPNRRGCPGFGQAWVDAISQDWGGKAMNDLLDATDSMAIQSYVNKDKMAAIGGSAGGFTTYWLEGNHNKRFKAFVSHAGVFNIESKHGSTDELWFPNWEFGGTFLSKQARAQYSMHSPHMFADNWDTPILISTGEKDYRVPYDQSLQAFTLAQVKGIPSELIYYPNEHHWMVHPQEQIIWYREFFNFLDKYCK